MPDWPEDTRDGARPVPKYTSYVTPTAAFLPNRAASYSQDSVGFREMSASPSEGVGFSGWGFITVTVKQGPPSLSIPFSSFAFTRV